MRRNDADTSVEGAKNHAVRFVAVTDSRKRKIRGLWKRGDRYYAQLRMEVEGGQAKPKRIALKATTLDQARAELEKIRTENRAGKLELPGRRPSFSEFAEEYLG